MVKKKLILSIITAACALLVGVGTTVAVLSSISGPLNNTFTIGEVEIELAETTGATYQLIPGATIAKDPRITVKGGSENCWLFVQVQHTSGAESYLTYIPAEGWTPLSGYTGLYYREVSDITSDQIYSVLDGDAITVSDTITKQQMSQIPSNPKLTFTAYAVQRHALDDPQSAWDAIMTQE